MKKILTIITLSACIAAVGGYNLYQQNTKDSKNAIQDNKEPIGTEAKVTIIDSSDLMKQLDRISNKEFEVSYTDGSESLEEMKGKSDSIVVGKVVSQKQTKSLGVVSTILVSKSTKGRKFDKIEIFQLGRLGDPEILQPGQEYVLFLGRQGGGGENLFFIKGGSQGAFLNDKGMLITRDIIMSKDIVRLKNDREKNTEFDALIELISK